MGYGVDAATDDAFDAYGEQENIQAVAGKKGKSKSSSKSKSKGKGKKKSSSKKKNHHQNPKEKRNRNRSLLQRKKSINLQDMELMQQQMMHLMHMASKKIFRL